MRIFITISLLVILASCETRSNRYVANAYFQKATQCDEQHDPVRAMQYYTKAIHADSNYAKAYINRGVDKSYLEDYAGAIRDYDTALAKDPNNTLALTNRGKNKYRLKNDTGAIADFNKAISLKEAGKSSTTEEDGDFSIEEMKLERAPVLYFTDSIQAALDDVQFCISKNVETETALYWRGAIYIRLHKKDLGCKDFRDAAALGNKDALRAMKRVCEADTVKK